MLAGVGSPRHNSLFRVPLQLPLGQPLVLEMGTALGTAAGTPRSIPFGWRAPALLWRQGGSLQTSPSPETQGKRDPSRGFWQAGNIPATCMKG